MLSLSTEYSSREEFLMVRECGSCGRTYRATRSGHRYCSATCRKRASRGALRSVVAGAVAAGSSSVEAAVRAELQRDGRASSALGAVAVVLARRLDHGGDTGSAVATLVRELRTTLAAVKAYGSASAGSVVDELRRKREERAARG